MQVFLSWLPQMYASDVKLRLFDGGLYTPKNGIQFCANIRVIINGFKLISSIMIILAVGPYLHHEHTDIEQVIPVTILAHSRLI